MTSPSSPKEKLTALLSKESRFDKDHASKNRKCKSPFSTGQSPPVSVSETSFSVISGEQRDLAAEWMHEVVIDSRVKLDVFLLSVTIMDSFLDVCPILPNQVQLLASACLLLAAKVKELTGHKDLPKLSEARIIDYTDNSITQQELKVLGVKNLSSSPFRC